MAEYTVLLPVMIIGEGVSNSDEGQQIEFTVDAENADDAVDRVGQILQDLIIEGEEKLDAAKE